MADVKMPDSIPCQFDKRGWAPCKKPSTNGWCSKHEKAKCSSCGEQATRSCDAQMGGLGCGAYLCDKCQHGRDGKHISAAEYKKEQHEERELRENGRESDRMLAERGVPRGLPKHLKELLAGNRDGYELMTCYALELKHGLMGFFPAIQKGTKIIAIVPDKTLIFRIWRSLEPRDSQLLASEYMVNRELGVVYHMAMSDFDKEQSRPLKLFSAEEVELLFQSNPAPFEWARGLLGASTSKQNFDALIERVAREQGIAA